MCYLRDKDFKDLFYTETSQKKDSLHLLSIMSFTAFSSSLLVVIFLWEAIHYDAPRVFIALFCIFNFLFACYTIYETLIDPFNTAIEKWKRQEKLKLGRAMLDTSPLFNNTISVNVSEMGSDTTHSPVPILTYSESPRAGRTRLEDTRQTASSLYAPELADSPEPIIILSSSPRRLRSRSRTHDIKPSARSEEQQPVRSQKQQSVRSQAQQPVRSQEQQPVDPLVQQPVPSTKYNLQVYAEVHREHDS